MCPCLTRGMLTWLPGHWQRLGLWKKGRGTSDHLAVHKGAMQNLSVQRMGVKNISVEAREKCSSELHDCCVSTVSCLIYKI